VVRNADGVKRDDLPSANLVVGIMSAPNHFAEREALRASWIQFQSLTDPKLNKLTLDEKKGIAVRFIIGNSPGVSSVENAVELESQTFHDIVRVPVTESYFNLTTKTSEFFKWVNSAYKYKWALKCDDDSFVRIDLLLEELLNRYKNTDRLYMGKIWSGTPTDRRIDNQTPWKQYPPFAAGAGYVLSADLISYVVRNLDALYTYPLEDVAVGSWIAALKVNYVDHPHFHSLPEGCDRDMIVQNPANLTVMKETFFNAVKGIPCHNKPDPFDRSTENVTDHVFLELGIPKPAPAPEKKSSMMERAGVQNLIATEPADEVTAVRDVEEDLMADGMSTSMMNGNMPSTDVMSSMNRGPAMGESTEFLQSAHAAQDRMNGMANDLA